MKTIVCTIGCRPDAIKMMPLILELRNRPNIRTVVLSTGQHRQMLDQVLSTFGVVPDYDLNIIYKCEKKDYLVKDNHNEMYVCNSNNNRIYKVSTQEEFIIEKSLDENWKVLCIVDDKVVCTSYVEGKAHTIIADLNGEIIFTNECETHN